MIRAADIPLPHSVPLGCYVPSVGDTVYVTDHDNHRPTRWLGTIIDHRGPSRILVEDAEGCRFIRPAADLSPVTTAADDEQQGPPSRYELEAINEHHRNT